MRFKSLQAQNQIKHNFIGWMIRDDGSICLLTWAQMNCWENHICIHPCFHSYWSSRPILEATKLETTIFECYSNMYFWNQILYQYHIQHQLLSMFTIYVLAFLSSTCFQKIEVGLTESFLPLHRGPYQCSNPDCPCLSYHLHPPLFEPALSPLRTFAELHVSLFTMEPKGFFAQNLLDILESNP